MAAVDTEALLRTVNTAQGNSESKGEGVFSHGFHRGRKGKNLLQADLVFLFIAVTAWLAVIGIFSQGDAMPSQ